MQKKVFIGLVVLAIALALGIFAAILSGQYIREQEEQFRADILADFDLVPVLVPGRSLEAGDTLEARDMMVREIPQKFMPGNAITPNMFRDFEGKLTRVPVERGTPMVTSFVGEEGANTGTSFSRVIPENMRALTVPVSGPSAVAGLLVPGDRLDLLVQTRGQDGSVLLPLLGNVEILATGSAMRSQTADGRYRDVTLKLTPEQARQVTEAQELGRLVVNLRNPGDREPMSMEATTAADIFDGRYEDILNPQQEDEEGARTVEIIQGVSRSAGQGGDNELVEAMRTLRARAQEMEMNR